MSVPENASAVDGPGAFDSKAENSANTDPPSPEINRDSNGLAESLVLIARFHGISATKNEILRTLAPNSDGMTLSDIDAAAERLGLKCQTENRDLRKIPALTLPAIVFSKGGEAIILHELDTKKRVATIQYPHMQDKPTAKKFDEIRPVLSGVVVFITPASSSAKIFQNGAKPPKGHWFWSTVRHFWPAYLQVVILGLMINALGIANPIFIMNVYDRVIPNLALPTLWALTIGVSIALISEAILRLLRSSVVDQAGEKVDMSVSGRLMEHILTLKLRENKETSGTLANRMKDLDVVRDVMTSSSVLAATDFIFIGIFLFVLWIVAGPLVLVPAIAAPLILVATFVLQLPLTYAVRQTQYEAQRRHSVLIEVLNSLETIKGVGGESWWIRAWNSAVAGSGRAMAKSRFWANATSTMTSFGTQAVSIIIIVWGVLLVLEGAITVGALIAANILAGRVLQPLGNIAQTLSRLIHARAALKGLNALMASETETLAPFSATSNDANKVPEIEFRNVTFSYPGAPNPALQGVSFKIAPGEKIALIGRVGSGKTTLGRLLSGLYEPDTGSVLVDGVDVRQRSIADLRETIGYAQQDIELFSGTLRDNIIVGAPLANDADILTAARLAGVDQFASRHPSGFMMRISERGRSLSGGERQAVSLARVLVRNPQVIFLDEPSAALDTNAERELMSRLSVLREKNITLMISTHRERLLGMVDRVLVFDNGRLAMDGPRHEVLRKLQSGQARPTEKAE